MNDLEKEPVIEANNDPGQSFDLKPALVGKKKKKKKTGKKKVELAEQLFIED